MSNAPPPPALKLLFPGFGLPLNFDPQPLTSNGPQTPDEMGEGKMLFATALPREEGFFDEEDQLSKLGFLTVFRVF